MAFLTHRFIKSKGQRDSRLVTLIAVRLEAVPRYRASCPVGQENAFLAQNHRFGPKIDKSHGTKPYQIGLFSPVCPIFQDNRKQKTVFCLKNGHIDTPIYNGLYTTSHIKLKKPKKMRI